MKSGDSKIVWWANTMVQRAWENMHAIKKPYSVSSNKIHLYSTENSTFFSYSHWADSRDKIEIQVLVKAGQLVP